MSDDNQNGAWPPPNTPEWLASELVRMPAPTADMDAPELDVDPAKAAERKTVLTMPKSYRWSSATAPELVDRVTDPRDSNGRALPVAALIALAPQTPRMLITGPADAGKTSIACAMLREWSRMNRMPATFVHAFRIGMARIQTRAGTGEAEIVEAAMRTPLALIDDVGAENHTANNAMLDVVFERHAEDLPMWLTTGWTSQQIISRYGAGFLRRISERALIVKVGREI